MKRREFLRNVLIGTSALAALEHSTGWGFASPGGMPIGLQLVTVFGPWGADYLKDAPGTLRRISQIGYKEIETGPVGQLSPKELKAMLDDFGLSTRSFVMTHPQMEQSLDSQIEFAQELGAGYLTFLIIPRADQLERFKSITEYERLADFCNKAGEKVSSAGLQLCFHPHNFDFRTFGDVVAFDRLAELTDSKSLQFELDSFWVTHAGKDLISYLRKYSGRTPLMHIKDRKPNLQPNLNFEVRGKGRADLFTEIGKGTIDWKKVFPVALQSGLKHFFVEQEGFDRLSPMESSKESFDYLQSLEV